MRDTSTIAARTSLPEERTFVRSLADVRWGVLISALLLSLVGLLTVHSASAEMELDYLPRHALRLALGLLVCAIGFSIDYQVLTKFSVPIYVGAMGLLVMVLFVGRIGGGARSWLGVGSAQIQPSDVAKIATVLLLARYLAGVNSRHLELRHLSVALLAVLAPMVLVALEPDLGGAVMLVPPIAGMVLIAGVRWRVLVAAGVLAIIVGLGVWNFVMLDYQRQRVKTFVSPQSEPLGAGYQLRQSKIAVGSGQLTGRGYMQGTQSQLRFLPARHTDFIFAVLAEEWGFLGVAVVLALYGLFVSNGVIVALRSRDRKAMLLVVGLLSGFAFHVLYNTAMVVGLLPITGIPLPFLSYGGSFMISNFFLTGLILGIDFRRYVNR
jgi:rod shape determining protein RodA